MINTDHISVGLAEVIKSLLTLGTNNIDSKTLTSNGYEVDSRHPHLAFKKYSYNDELWAVTYKRLTVSSDFNLSSLYREGR